MGIVFALRGTSKNALYTGGFKTPAEYGTNSVDAGDIDHVINLDQSSFAQHALHYDGRLALPTTQQWSILARVATGSTTDSNQIFYAGGGCQFYGQQARFSGSGTIVFTHMGSDGNTNTTQTYSFAYAAGTYYDLVWTNDLSITTNALNLWKDGVKVSTTTNSATRAAIPYQYGLQLLIGSQNAAAQNSTRLKVSEFVIWDSIIDPTSVALTGGTGSLNGAPRTQYVNASSLEGLSYTDPGIANVKSGVSYTYGGASQTGTYAPPTGKGHLGPFNVG